MVPIEPPPTRWQLPRIDSRADDLVGVGADLEPGTILAAYRAGLFPMPAPGLFGGKEMAWWSPNPRGVIPLNGLRVSRSLRQSAKRYKIRVDTAFAEVVRACADPERPGAWITDDIRDAYQTLHQIGWAHSVEAWTADDRLAGGLYGISIGGFFAGESMFHARSSWGRDASKVALVALVGLLGDDHRPGRLLDVQWGTRHLIGLGAIEIPRTEYLSRLSTALRLPLPEAFSVDKLSSGEDGAKPVVARSSERETHA